MTRGAGSHWPGCHGVWVRSASDLGLGYCRGEPLAEVVLDIGPVERSDGQQVWTVAPEHHDHPTPSDSDASLYRDSDGRLTLQAGDVAHLTVSADRRRIVVRAPLDPVRLQLVASVGLPLALAERSLLVLHAAAVAIEGRAVVIAGVRGAGKSSSLVGLTDAGWAPLTEDVCVLEQVPSGIRVWPGPPWVRRHEGEPGPAGSAELFAGGGKSAWDIGARRPFDPMPVVQLVVLQPPGGAAPRWQPLDRPGAVEVLAEHAVWLGDQAERGQRLFGPVLQLAGQVPVARLRLPSSADWLDVLAAELRRSVASPEAF
jgi:hypothetical protein